LPPAFSQGASVGCDLVATGTTVQVIFAFQNAADSDTLLVAGMPDGPIINNHATPLGTIINLSTTPMEVLPFIFNDISSKAFANAVDGGPAGFTGAATVILAGPGGPANSEGYLNADPTSAADGIAHSAYAALTTGTGPVTSTSASLFCGDPITGTGNCAATGRPNVLLSAAVVDAMNAIDSNSAHWLLVGFEDELNKVPGFPQTDEDFNDLIFAFHNDAPGPQPASPAPVPAPAPMMLLGAALAAFGLARSFPVLWRSLC
jgi:hypothetical protein